jgi:Sulfotransferase domain
MRRLEPHQKVFGLGLSKTGTSSLGEALNQLGIRTIHYPFDARTYAELTGGVYRLSLLEEYQAVVDIPVAPFYPQLDACYPGSKFILTVRDREAWLRSAELHWQLMEQWWDRFPEFRRFQEFIGAAVYGTLRFHRDRFAYVYDTHLRNVREYFRDRPDDLLSLDVCGGEGWAPLCRFLGLPNPGGPFPHANEWMHRLIQATDELDRVVPADEPFLLVDQASFGDLAGHGGRAVPFTERDGQYWGPPADDAAAVRELDARVAAGVRWAVFGWPAFWWLDYYPGLARRLHARGRVVHQSDRLIVFHLAPESDSPAGGAP